MTTLEETLAKALQVSREALERDEAVTLVAIGDWLESRGFENAARYVRHDSAVGHMLDEVAQMASCRGCGRVFGRSSHLPSCGVAEALFRVNPNARDHDLAIAHREALVESLRRQERGRIMRPFRELLVRGDWPRLFDEVAPFDVGPAERKVPR